MAETLTVDPNSPAEIVGEQDGVQLTADEQDSLAVGEQMVEQQDKLLAGKYRDAEELEKAYIQLSKKLGEKGEAEEAEQAEPEQDDSPTVSPQVELITQAAQEFADSGDITAETMKQFDGMTSEELVRAYMEVQRTPTPEPDGTDRSSDITDVQVNEIKNFAGGEQSYQNIVDWAGDNLDKNSIKAFDNIINSGSVDAIKLAVNGLKAQYESANGFEGKMVTGKAPTNNRDVFRSQAELVRAMSDKRYDNDPAYRQDIIAKLDRSDNLQF